MNTNKRKTHFQREWERVNQELLKQIYRDPDLVQQASPEEVQNDLREMGIDPDALPALWSKILAKARRDDLPHANMRQKRIPISSMGIRWLKDLRNYIQPTLVAGQLNDDKGLENPPKEILLTDEGFSEAQLAEKLPWAGPKVKISKGGIDAEKGTAVYYAFVSSINRDAPRTGVLRIVLFLPDGKTGEVRLSANERKKMFQGIDLPSDSSLLRYALFIE